jgi:hypothetical protein
MHNVRNPNSEPRGVAWSHHLAEGVAVLHHRRKEIKFCSLPAKLPRMW